MQILRPLPSPPLRACIALAISILMTACGGGGGEGGGSHETPLPPPIEPPVVRQFTNFQAASSVIGQLDAESGEANRGGVVSGETLYFPGGMAIAPGGGLLVADSFNNRVLHFAAVPSGPGASANAVIGQASLDDSLRGVSEVELNGPAAVAVGAGKIAVADAMSNRVLIYDYPLPADGSRPTASVVLGQEGDFLSSTPGCDADRFKRPSGVAITPQGQLIVADSANHRVLVWSAIPSDPNNVPAPTVVLGQETLTHCVSNDDLQDGTTDTSPTSGQPVATARTLAEPVGVWSDGRRLVVADSLNDRVLIWTSFPTDNFQRANLVLGHSTFSDTLPNSEHDEEADLDPTSRTLSYPNDVHSDGTSLVVADSNNHRVLIWREFPQGSFQAADVVLGHSGFDQDATNDGDDDGMADAPTAQVFRSPGRVLLTPDALLVSDSFNRVLIFRK